jgi:hypothetical protein
MSSRKNTLYKVMLYRGQVQLFHKTYDIRTHKLVVTLQTTVTFIHLSLAGIDRP